MIMAGHQNGIDGQSATGAVVSSEITLDDAEMTTKQQATNAWMETSTLVDHEDRTACTEAHYYVETTNSTAEMNTVRDSGPGEVTQVTKWRGSVTWYTRDGEERHPPGYCLG